MMLGFHYAPYYHNAYSENEYLANLGYVVLAVNYRGGLMYGRAFRERPDLGWRGASEYKDILAAGKYLQSLPYVDPKRIGMWGGSWGGYLTSLALARNSDLFAAGVDIHGVHDWYRFSAFDGSAPGSTPGAPDRADAIKLAYESSTISGVPAWKSPMLFVMGDDDRDVPFLQAVDLLARLREQHVHVEQLIIPDELHEFLLWKSWVRVYGSAGEFFDRQFKK
jgi:dipeptidyl aminopeptidase/acylaminoacyl peptidase